jgi:polyhydroxyalkanoate synthase
VVGVPSVRAALGELAAVLGQGRALARESACLGGELARITVGRCDVVPAKNDRRFSDPAWTANPVYRRIEQAYLASAATVDNLVEELDKGVADFRLVEQARFAADVLTAALAPTNYLPTNPAALKHAFDTGGSSLVHGVRHLVDDLRHNGGCPRWCSAVRSRSGGTSR